MMRNLLKLAVMIGMILFIPLFTVKAVEIVPISTTWDAVQGSNSDWALYTDFIILPTQTQELEIEVPNTIYLEESNNDYTSSMELFYKDSTILILEITDYNPNLHGYASFDLDQISVLNNLDVRDLMSIRFIFAQAFSSVPDEYIDDWTSNFTIDVIRLARFVLFYSRLLLYTQVSYYDTFSLPDDPPAPLGYTFSGWMTITGDRFDINAISDDAYDENGYLYLYAVFLNLRGDTYEPTPINPNNPTQLYTLLTALGLYNDAGFMIIFLVLSLVIIFGLLALKINGIVIVICHAMLTSLFIFLGWLPLFAIILIIMIYLIALLITSRGGISNEG